MKFSVILPTYNRENFISNAIKSVINQTFLNWELIIIDDGSTDNTKKVVGEFVKLDNRIIFLQQKNKERSAARNYGIQNSSGDYICFLDSDDLYYETHLEEFNKLIYSSKFHKGIYFSGLSFGKYCDKKEKYNLSHSNNIEFVLINTIGTPRACISKELLKENLFNENIRISEDKELWVRILKANKLFYHHKKTFIEVDHSQRSINLISKKENLTTLKFILKSNKKLIKKKTRIMVLSDAYFSISKALLKKQFHIKSIYYVVISILININHKQTLHKLLLILSILNLYSNKIKNQYL